MQKFMNSLLEKRLTAPTISNAMGVISKTLKYAHRRELIPSLPQMPKSQRTDRARGWFTTSEYWRLYRQSQRPIGKTYEIDKKIVNGKTSTSRVNA
jgi:hypothetical protein